LALFPAHGSPANRATTRRRPGIALFGGHEHERQSWNTKEAHMGINWSKDVDKTLSDAKEQGRPILLDFSAAPE
jgi:hypothetical protein